jgi:hypothetical protein
MKIKVIWEKTFDSDEFYNGFSEGEIGELTEEQFIDGILDELEENPYEIISEMKTELIEE